MREGVVAPERKTVSVRGTLPSLVVVADAARFQRLGGSCTLLEDVKGIAVLIADFEELVRAQILVLFRQLINAIGIFIDFMAQSFFLWDE